MCPDITNKFVNWFSYVYFADNVESLMDRLVGGQWRCLECGYQSNKKFNVQVHVEAKHTTPMGYICPHCPQILKNRVALNNHKAKYHKN